MGMDDEIARMLYAKRATPEPCHVCGGKCCRDDLGYRTVHMGAEFYEHVCDDCRDGEKYVPPRTAVSPLTLCTDPRCVASQRCWRAENEDFGNAPGENYGPRCTPVPSPSPEEVRHVEAPDSEHCSCVPHLRAEIERLRAQRILDNEEAAQIYDFARDKAKARERAAVVTFLRKQADQWEKDGAGWAAMNHASAMIERGLHRHEEKP